MYIYVYIYIYIYIYNYDYILSMFDYCSIIADVTSIGIRILKRNDVC